MDHLREADERELERVIAAQRKRDQGEPARPTLPSPKIMLWAVIGIIALLGVALKIVAREPVSIEAQQERLAAEAAASPSATLARDATAFYQAYLDQGRPCDAAGAKAAVALNSNDVVQIYSAASEGEEICKQAARAVGILPIPSDADSAKRDEFKDARETCQVGLEVQQEALGALAQMANGDMRAETQAKMRKAREDADTFTLGCAGKMLQVVKTSGGALPPSVDPHA